MKRPALDQMSADQLLARFMALALEQDHALLGSEIAKVNSLGEVLHGISLELKNRAGDQRRILLRLYDHPNVHVRLKAVKATLAVAPELARRALQAIAESGQYPQAGDAGMSLSSLDRGTFEPT